MLSSLPSPTPTPTLPDHADVNGVIDHAESVAMHMHKKVPKRSAFTTEHHQHLSDKGMIFHTNYT